MKPLQYMLARLKKLISTSESNSFCNLRKLGLDETHTSLKLDPILETYKAISEEKQIKLIDELILSTKSKNWVLQLKAYIIIHYFIAKIFPPYLQQKFLMIQFETQGESKSQDIKSWIRMNITKQYHSYLVKLCINYELYKYCIKTEPNALFSAQSLQEINKNFKILNMIVEIMQNQINFCKMGRYYPQYLAIFYLFVTYLKDVKLFYDRIKCTMDYILNSHQYLGNQQLTHGFHFLNEALATSDRQYQFFHNRYFYGKMSNFDYPNFYKLDYEKYHNLIKNIRKRGLKLEHLFYKSKNKQRQRFSLNKTMQGCEQTAETIQNRCQTLASFGYNYRYEEVLATSYQI